MLAAASGSSGVWGAMSNTVLATLWTGFALCRFPGLVQPKNRLWVKHLVFGCIFPGFPPAKPLVCPFAWHPGAASLALAAAAAKVLDATLLEAREVASCFPCCRGGEGREGGLNIMALLWMDEILHHLRDPGMIIPL